MVNLKNTSPKNAGINIKKKIIRILIGENAEPSQFISFKTKKKNSLRHNFMFVVDQFDRKNAMGSAGVFVHFCGGYIQIFPTDSINCVSFFKRTHNDMF